MSARVKKVLLLLLAVALLAGSGQVQEWLNRDRGRLGLTRASVLESAPPLLAFTTVALGGFRGLISNYLWIRANDLQLDDKFFEAAQLADWITGLEPHFPQVWIFQAWNMAYNISVKFKDFPDRWRWVERGIELLRDDGLRYNPNEILIYRELGWFFQHKMGQNLDDANWYYKSEWAKEMTPFFGPNGTNFAALVNPQTPEQKTNALGLREKYKIDPVLAQKVDAQYGPFDWRLPEAHAIYWAALGLDEARKNPGKVKPDDLITLRRIIYQSTQQAFFHGRLIADPFSPSSELVPNLDLTARCNDTYEAAAEKDPKNRDHIALAQRNFLRTAVYFLYVNNRLADAAKWFRYLGEKFPDKPIIDGDTNSFPRNVTLDEYAVACVQGDINETSQDRVTAAVGGLLAHYYYELALGHDDRAANFRSLAARVYENYQAKAARYPGGRERTGLLPFPDLDRAVRNQWLDPRQELLPFAARAALRSQLGLLPETNAPPVATPTNAPPAAPSTNRNTLTPAGK
jgi:hypothetical protein